MGMVVLTPGMLQMLGVLVYALLFMATVYIIMGGSFMILYNSLGDLLS